MEQMDLLPTKRPYLVRFEEHGINRNTEILAYNMADARILARRHTSRSYRKLISITAIAGEPRPRFHPRNCRCPACQYFNAPKPK